MNVEETVKKIKQSFRLYMNGVTAQSLREKSGSGQLSWGASMQHLQMMAREYEKDYHLAVELWKCNVRECKLLATMLMPAESMPEEVCDIWMDDCPTQEIAEQMVFHLLQHVAYAPQLAYRWISTDSPLRQIAGYTLLGRLFMQGRQPDTRGINELLDQAAAALKSEGNVGVKHAAMNCLIRFADISPQHEEVAKKALRAQGLEGVI